MNTTHTDPVYRNATCKRCESKTVTWQQSDRGKWYLTEVFNYSVIDDQSNDRTDRLDFHSKYCGKPEAHAAKQGEIFAALRGEEAEREAASEKREQERIEREADLLEVWYAMTPDGRAAKIENLEREIKATLNGITMDYFTEWMRATQHAAALRAEIEMYLMDEED